MYKLGLKFGENIRKLADAPGFWHTIRPQVGSAIYRGSKPSKHPDGLNTIVDTTQKYLKTEKWLLYGLKL